MNPQEVKAFIEDGIEDFRDLCRHKGWIYESPAPECCSFEIGPTGLPVVVLRKGNGTELIRFFPPGRGQKGLRYSTKLSNN